MLGWTFLRRRTLIRNNFIWFFDKKTICFIIFFASWHPPVRLWPTSVVTDSLFNTAHWSPLPGLCSLVLVLQLEDLVFELLLPLQRLLRGLLQGLHVLAHALQLLLHSLPRSKAYRCYALVKPVRKDVDDDIFIHLYLTIVSRGAQSVRKRALKKPAHDLCQAMIF